MANVIYPSDEYLPEYNRVDVEVCAGYYAATAAAYAEAGYEYPEEYYDPDDEGYYGGYGEYVRPEMDCN